MKEVEGGREKREREGEIVESRQRYRERETAIDRERAAEK